MKQTNKKDDNDEGVCPNCGYCKHCGHAPVRLAPYPYPYYYYPYWMPYTNPYPWWQPATITVYGNNPSIGGSDLNVGSVSNGFTVTASPAMVTSGNGVES